MMNTEKTGGQRLRRARIATALISLIAVSALAIAIYAFQQKKKAEDQTRLANQRAIEAMRQQQLELQQKIIADSNREQATQQTEQAQENAKSMLEQKQRADSQTQVAKANEAEARLQEKIANEQKRIAETQADIARKNLEEATKQKAFAEEQKNIAKDEKQISGKLTELGNSRALAKESVLLLNQNLVDSSRQLALQAYQLNENNDGPIQSNDIYNALHYNWTKSINYRNQAAIHMLPVHCISGSQKNNFVFSADESGLLCESVVKNNGLEKIASYPIKEEVRALCVSPDGSSLIAVTAHNDGILFSVSSSNISPQKTFKFDGIGKAAAFSDNENFLVLSTKGFYKFRLAKIEDDDFINQSGFNAFAVCKSGRMIVASNNEIDIYNSWNDLVHNIKTVLQKFDTKVTSVAIDNSDRFVAAGTYSGAVWLFDLKNSSAVWSKALHSSSVNALKFSVVNDNILQLASAGSDQVIRLVNIDAILRKDSNEDILTLKGHTKWVYDLYYTPDGKWLFSSGEDNKIIAWKPAMKDIYLILNSR